MAGDAAREGAELSSNLSELGVSLRSNAERLMRDVKLIHGTMVARLDRFQPPAGSRRIDAAAVEDPVEDLEVPEFIPRVQSGGRGRSHRGSSRR
jgi:hypothetical protein